MAHNNLRWGFENSLIFDVVTGSSDGGTTWGSGEGGYE